MPITKTAMPGPIWRRGSDGSGDGSSGPGLKSSNSRRVFFPMTASGGIGRDWAMLPARPVVGQETPGPAGSAGLIPGESDAGVSLRGKHGSGLERQRPIRKPQVELPEKPGSLRMLTVSDRGATNLRASPRLLPRAYHLTSRGCSGGRRAPSVWTGPRVSRKSPAAGQGS
jgi:hypothetical protein